MLEDGKVEQLITEQTAQRLASALERVADVLELGYVEKEAQLDRIEAALTESSASFKPRMKEVGGSMEAFLIGGVGAVKELNKRRSAEQRRKKK